MASFMVEEKSNASASHMSPISDLTRVLIVGAGELGRQLAGSLEADGCHQVVGFVDDHIHDLSVAPWSVLGRRNATANLVRDHQIDEVYVAYAPTWQQMLIEELSAHSPHVDVHVVPSPFESMLRVGDVKSRGDIALVRVIPKAGGTTELCKRAFDVAVSTGTLLVLSPVLLLIAAAIKLTSDGPVIFAQERVGRYGKPFTVFKFRTMIQNAEQATGPIRSSGKSDARLTVLGRWLRLFRIDEIPQLLNVLRGEMSLVGPRPERPYFVHKFQCMLPSYAKRHQVRPGITGLAQIYGGYHTDARDKLRFDLIYISHQSLWFDISILVRTILVILIPNGK